MNPSALPPFSLSEIWWKGIINALDRNGSITFLNGKGGEIHKLLPGEVVGISWFEQFLPKKERERVKPVFFERLTGQDEALCITAKLPEPALGYVKRFSFHLWNPEEKISIHRSVSAGHGLKKYQMTKVLVFVHRVW